MVTFVIKHYASIITSGDWQNMLQPPMFYGFKDTLLWNEHYGVVAAIALPIYFLTKQIVFAFNATAILIVLLSFAAMYVFAWHMSKNAYASVLAGLIFVLNPAVFTRFPDHTNLVLLCFIPLIFLFFERLLKSPTGKNIFFFFLFLSLQLLSSFYYAIFLTILLPFYTVIRLIQIKAIPKVFNRGFLVGVVLLGIVAFGQVLLYVPSVGREEAKESSQRFLTLYSAWPSDYLFTSEKNIIYGGFKQKVKEAIPAIVHDGVPSEHSLFLGLVPVTLFLLGFTVLPKTRYKPIWIAFVILTIVALLLSFGPKIGLYGLVDMVNPLLSFIRVPARFGVFVFFGLSIIAALTFTEILKIASPKKKHLLAVLVIMVVIIEYWNGPFGFLEISKETKEFYKTLNEQQQIHVILNLPIANLIENDALRSRAEYLDTHYLLWAAMFHDKKLLNGHTSFVPYEYYVAANILTTSFPTLETLKLVKSWRVDGIILNKDEYNHPQQYFAIKSLLEAFGVPIISQTENLVLFDFTRWDQSLRR